MKKAPAFTILPAVLLLLFLLALFAPSSALADTTPTTLEKRVLKLVNQKRTARGLPAVRFKKSLILAARAHSRDLASRGVLSHTSADGSTAARRLIAYGYKRTDFSYWTCGEDIACASESIATARRIVSLWMHSTSHRAILLKRSFRDVGVGTAASSGGIRYFTLDMGRRIR